MGLFSGKNFSFKNIITMPFDIVKNNLSAVNEFRKNPKKAFGKHQDGMTKILGGVGFNEDSKLVKNSDAIMGAILGGVAAGGAMGAGGAAGASGGAASGTAASTGGQVAGANLVSAGGQGMAPVYESVGTTVGNGAATNAGTAGAQAGAQSGAWLKNPYVQTGMGLLQQRQANQTQPAQVQMPQVSAARYAQQEQQGYTPYGRGGLLG